MTNGVRPAKKLSQNQLTQGLIEMNTRLHIFSQGVSNDMRRMNIVLFSLLKDLGMCDEKVCPSCETINLRPKLSDIEIDPHCAECGMRIDPLPEEAFRGEMMDDEE